jgi:glutathione S-transferase
MLNWAPYAGVNLASWPAVHQYYERHATRPSVAKATAEEMKMYSARRARSATIAADKPVTA